MAVCPLHRADKGICSMCLLKALMCYKLHITMHLDRQRRIALMCYKLHITMHLDRQRRIALMCYKLHITMHLDRSKEDCINVLQVAHNDAP